MKFNFLESKTDPVNKVRIRAYGRDRYAGLRGRDYVNTRNKEDQLQRHSDDVPASLEWMRK